MSEWIPEPWDCDGGEIFALSDPDNIALATVHDMSESFEGDDPVARANARRIVACVNACRDVSTENLQSGCVHEMILDLDEVRQREAELLAAAVEVATWLEQRTEHYQGLGSGSVAAQLHAHANILRAAILRARGETPPA
jgi:5'-deoxynucleotidase YfbR-like HD superfamily hydrolase